MNRDERGSGPWGIDGEYLMSARDVIFFSMGLYPLFRSSTVDNRVSTRMIQSTHVKESML
jgi:hypothetical protein